MREVGIVLVSAALTACATAYQGHGFTGGFTETRLAPDMFRVSFTGNSFTAIDQVQDFALLRAAEITTENGATHFSIVTNANQSSTRTIMTGGTVTTTGTGTTYQSPQLHTLNKPGVGMLIRTYPNRPEGDSFEAAYVAKFIREKYGLK